mgnify:FL=1
MSKRFRSIGIKGLRLSIDCAEKPTVGCCSKFVVAKYFDRGGGLLSVFKKTLTCCIFTIHGSAHLS